MFAAFEAVHRELEAHLKSTSRAPDPTQAELLAAVRAYLPLWAAAGAATELPAANAAALPERA